MDEEEVDMAGREERPRLRGYQGDKPGAGRWKRPVWVMFHMNAWLMGMCAQASTTRRGMVQTTQLRGRHFQING